MYVYSFIRSWSIKSSQNEAQTEKKGDDEWKRVDEESDEMERLVENGILIDFE